MYLRSVILSDFRNYHALSLDLPVEGALFYGLNGAGKTALLEAMHLLCLGRSQRGAPRLEMIRHGQDVAQIQGRFVSERRKTSSIAQMGFSRDKQVRLSFDGVKVETFREWFNHAAVVSFGPDDLALVSGPPAVRRRFIDMLACQVDQGMGSYLDHLMGYQKALLNRNRLLGSSTDETLFDVYEASMVEHGLYLKNKREELLSFCQPVFESFYAEISGGQERGTMAYRPWGNREKHGSGDWADVFLTSLKSKRKQDILQGFTTVGPHRDDILFFLDKNNAKVVASQGQCRTLALSLRLASVCCLSQRVEQEMIFLVDDAFSELDDRRISFLYPLLRNKGQVFMTSPTERIRDSVDLRKISIVAGSVGVQ